MAADVRAGRLVMLAVGLPLSLAVAVRVTHYSQSLPQRLVSIAAITVSIAVLTVLFWRWVVLVRGRFHPVAGALAAALAVPLGLFVAFFVQLVVAVLAEPEQLSDLIYCIPLAALLLASTFLSFPRTMGVALLIAAAAGYLAGRWCRSRSLRANALLDPAASAGL